MLNNLEDKFFFFFFLQSMKEFHLLDPSVTTTQPSKTEKKTVDIFRRYSRKEKYINEGRVLFFMGIQSSMIFFRTLNLFKEKMTV